MFITNVQTLHDLAETSLAFQELDVFNSGQLTH